jgi:hypothetical protein
LRVLRVQNVADALADDLDLVGILEKPADGRDLDGLGLRERRQIAPLAARLTAVMPANDDQRAAVIHDTREVIRHES